MEDADRLQHHRANILSTGPAARIGGGPEMEGEPDTDGRDKESFGVRNTTNFYRLLFFFVSAFFLTQRGQHGRRWRRV